MSFFGPCLPPSPTLWLTAASVLLGLILYLNSLLITEVEVLGFFPHSEQSGTLGALGEPGTCPCSSCLFAQ